jgi:hypothetical protein
VEGVDDEAGAAPFEHIMETSCENTETANLIDAAAKDNYGRSKK